MKRITLIFCGMLLSCNGSEGESNVTPIQKAFTYLSVEHWDGPCQSGASQCSGMHCCPATEAMVGVYNTNNTFR
jgi:hypothetical protein